MSMLMGAPLTVLSLTKAVTHAHQIQGIQTGGDNNTAEQRRQLAKLVQAHKHNSAHQGTTATLQQRQLTAVQIHTDNLWQQQAQQIPACQLVSPSPKHKHLAAQQTIAAALFKQIQKRAQQINGKGGLQPATPALRIHQHVK